MKYEQQKHGCATPESPLKWIYMHKQEEGEKIDTMTCKFSEDL